MKPSNPLNIALYCHINSQICFIILKKCRVILKCYRTISQAYSRALFLIYQSSLNVKIFLTSLLHSFPTIVKETPPRRVSGGSPSAIKRATTYLYQAGSKSFSLKSSAVSPRSPLCRNQIKPPRPMCTVF